MEPRQQPESTARAGEVSRPHRALFRIRGPAIGLIFQSLAPEIPDEVNPRAKASCHLDRKGALLLEVRAADIPALRASLNMLLRLIAVADEMAELSRRGE